MSDESEQLRVYHLRLTPASLIRAEQIVDFVGAALPDVFVYQGVIHTNTGTYTNDGDVAVFKEATVAYEDRSYRAQALPLSTEPIRHFNIHEHLPPALQRMSFHFYRLASLLHHQLPDTREKEKALDRLLESKDAAIRAMLP